MLKKVLKISGLGLGLIVVVAASYVAVVVSRFNGSMDKVYDVPMPAIARSTDPAVLERGRHLAEALGACATADCHGADLGGGKTIEMGPLGTLTGPNITSAGRLAEYSDGELARLVLHGVKRDGRSVRLMPVHETNWWPDADVQAVISYLRSVPPVERGDGPIEIGLLGKVLDRHDLVPFDVARRIRHDVRIQAPEPAPTAAYGAFLARGCTGCHGETLSGGKIPGAPPHMAVPTNITPHETGLKSWSYETFEHLLRTGERPDGKKLDPMMPVEALAKMNETEKRALWAFLQAQPARPFGNR